MRNFAAFVQDRASYERVTLNLGLRWSYYDGTIPEQSGGGGRVVPGAPAVSRRSKPAISWNTLAPRTGIVFKLTEDGKNVAKASYSRYYESMYTSEFTQHQPEHASRPAASRPTSWTRRSRTATARSTATSSARCKSQFVPRSNTIDPNLKDPKNDEIMFAFQRELANNCVVQRRLDPALVQRPDDQSELLRAAVQHGRVRPPTRRHASSPTSGPDNIRGTGDDRNADVLQRAAGSTSARTRSSTPTAATTCRSTARSDTRRSRSRSASACRTAGRCRARTCGRASTATSRCSARHTTGTASTSPTRTTCSTSSVRAAAPTISRTPSSCSAATRRRGASTSARTSRR